MKRAARSALALVAAAAVTSCGVLPPPDAAVPIESLELEPRRIQGDVATAPRGAAMELLSGVVDGGRLAVVAQRDADGLCLAAWGADGGSMCGALPDWEIGRIGPTMVFGEDEPPFRVMGFAAPEVAEVVLELEGDRRARATLVSLDPIGVEGSAFIVHVATADAHGLVGLDEDGAEIVRLEVVRP